MRLRKKKIKRVFENKILPVLVIIVIAAVAFYSLSHPPGTNMNLPPPHKAAIVDQLSLTEPNQSLIQTAIEILQSAGFTVDYYEPEDVTVDLYRTLPSKGYGLIIFRVHSAGGLEGDEPLYLFTSEPFVLEKYLLEQAVYRVVCVGTSEEPPFYFGISPQFVRYSMEGEFQNTIMLMMTCSALTYEEMADAFVEKGASVCVGWNGLVKADHNDRAITALVSKLVAEKLTIEQAVAQVRGQVGLDPEYNTQLKWCPAENGDYAIPRSD